MIGNEPSNSDEKHEYTIHIKRREQIKKKETKSVYVITIIWTSF